MLEKNKLQILLNLLGDLTNEELIWVNGYLNGIVSKQLQKEEHSSDT